LTGSNSRLGNVVHNEKLLRKPANKLTGKLDMAGKNENIVCEVKLLKFSQTTQKIAFQKRHALVDP
jgi:hypothetical protein